MDTVSTMCGICENPNILCNCDNSWHLFDDYLKDKCTGKQDFTNNVKYTDISISTMTTCFSFNQFINLKLLKEKLNINMNINYNPGSKKSKIPKKKEQIHSTTASILNWVLLIIQKHQKYFQM